MKGLKRFLSVTLATLMALSTFPLTALAAEDFSAEYDGVFWSYTAETDTLYINTQSKTSLKGYDKPETSRAEQLLPTLYEAADGEVKYWDGQFSKLVVGKNVTGFGSSIRLGYDEKNNF